VVFLGGLRRPFDGKIDRERPAMADTVGVSSKSQELLPFDVQPEAELATQCEVVLGERYP
jgi:hypothetical protein